MNLGLPQCELTTDSCESPSILETLRRRQLELRTRLDAVTAALEALEASPEVARVLELIAKAH